MSDSLDRELTLFSAGEYNRTFVERCGCPLVGVDVVIGVGGQIHPCSQAPIIKPQFVVGNVKSSALEDILQDDMIGPVSTLAFGHGALGHLYGRHFSIPAGGLDAYVEALRAGDLPAMLGAPVGGRFERAFFVAEQACRGTLTAEAYQRVFGHELAAAFGGELAFLSREGLLSQDGERFSKPPSPRFQLTHLLAFLLWDARALAVQLAAIDSADPSEASVATPSTVASLRSRADVDAIGALDFEDDAPLWVDVGEGIDGATATALRALVRTKRRRLHVHGEPSRDARQFGALAEEITPSVLWTRLAVRASQAAQGAQRLAASRTARSATRPSARRARSRRRACG